MNATAELLWTFEKVNPHESGSSGKVSDLFRNEGVEPRGHLAADAPSLAATLMAREVIQNSWDAAQEARAGTDGGDASPFALDFNFREVSGADKSSLSASLGLEQLAVHAAAVAGDSADTRRNVLGLGEDDCLQSLDDEVALRYCEIVEHGASGMYGPWAGAESRMYLAMLSIGFNQKADGSGGTFGFGKAGLIRASLPRVVVAYTCFRERAEDPGVTRRLLGVAYWGAHKRNGVALKGFARYGKRTEDDHVVPFENEDADDVAAALGMRLRRPDTFEQLGTTFLVLDPSVPPAELRVAIERNWWPALLDEKFSVLISLPDGTETVCRPRSNAQLSAFVEAYDHLTSGAGGGGATKIDVSDLGSYQPHGHERYELGRLALVADPAGWSFPDENGEVEAAGQSRSLVALMRDPRMIVEYHLPGRDISRRVPFVRGVFVANPQVNALLGRTEPKAHDKWDTRESDDVDALATKIAGRIVDGIKDRVKRFQEELRPPVDETGAVRLQRLDEKLKRLLQQRGETPPPPPPGDRPFTFAIEAEREPLGSDLVLRGRVTVGLASGITAVELPARVRIAFALDEDGRRGDSVPLRIDPPAGFTHVPGIDTRFDGNVPSAGVTFEFVSDAYRADWTGELLVSAETPTAAAAA